MRDDMWCKQNSFSVGGIILAAFILAWGIVWLGNDLNWWKIDFPFWPVVAIMIGLAILLGEIRKGFRSE